MGRYIFARVNLVSFATVQGCHTTLFQAWISCFHSNNASFQEWANQREHSIFGKLFAPVLLPETRPIRPWLFSVLLQRALRLWVPLGCSVSIEAKCSLSCSCYRSCKTCGSIFWEKKKKKQSERSMVGRWSDIVQIVRWRVLWWKTLFQPMGARVTSELYQKCKLKLVTDCFFN